MSKKFNFRELVEISLGTLFVAIGFYYLLLPTDLVTGGVTGLSIVFKETFKISSDQIISIFIFIVNMVLLLIGYLILGKEFFFKTIYGTILLPLFTFIFSLIPVANDFFIKNIQSDGNLLIIVSTISGVLTGLGLGLVFRNNATTGGSDVIQRILYEKLKVPYSVALYITDGIIIALGLLIFGIENTYFAVLTLIIAGIVIDKVNLNGRDGYTLFIVTTKYSILKEQIYKQIDRGVTKASVIGGYSEKSQDMIICTISKRQLYHIKAIIAEYDEQAFTFITKTVESVGQGFSIKWLKL